MRKEFILERRRTKDSTKFLTLKGQFHGHTVIFKGLKMTFRKIEKKTIPR